MYQLRAIVNFHEKKLYFSTDQEKYCVPLLNKSINDKIEAQRSNINNVSKENEEEEEENACQFFVENLSLREGDFIRRIILEDKESRVHDDVDEYEFIENEETCDRNNEDFNEGTCDIDNIGVHMGINNIGVQNRGPRRITNNDIELMIESVPTLRFNEKEQLKEILMNNRDVFSEEPGLATCYIHKIEFTDHSPIFHKTRHIPQSILKAVDMEIKNLLELGIIEESNTPYINPLCIRVKRDQKIRITIDARLLNNRSIPDHCRNENIDELLTRFQGTRYLSSIDLSKSFLQIKLHPETRKYTGFIHRGRCYQFRRTPFGLQSSGAALLRALQKIFDENADNFLIRYIDDLVILSPTYELHMEHLNYVLSTLRENGFTVKPSKIQLCRPSIKFVGYIISTTGIRCDPERIQSIIDSPVPKNTRGMKRFLGLTLYQSRFIPNYSYYVSPFSHLLSKKNKWKWTETEEKAFLELKEQMCRSILLHHPDPELQYVIHCDASIRGIAAVLYQENYDKNLIVIATASRCLRPIEKLQHITILELTSINFALKKFKTYIYDKKIILYTDHSALTHIHKCKLTSTKLSRMINDITSYDLEIRHLKGSENKFADYLSRQPCGIEEAENTHSNVRELEIFKIKFQNNKVLSQKLQNLRLLQTSDQILMKKLSDSSKICDLTNSDNNAIIDSNTTFGRRDNLIYKLCGVGKDRGWRIYVPQNLESDLIKAYHISFGHPGIKKTSISLAEFFYIQHLDKKVRKFIQSCITCQECKVYKTNIDLGYSTMIRQKPGQLVTCDAKGPLITTRFGCKYIFIVFDLFSHYIKLYPVKKINTKTCLNKLIKDYIPTIKHCEAILSDNATPFQNNLWKNTLNIHGIKTYYSSVRHPQGNRTERAIQIISELLRIFCNNKHSAWYDYCEIIENLINYSIDPQLNEKPATLMFGKEFYVKPTNTPERIILDKTDISIEERWKTAYQNILKKAKKREEKAKLKNKHKKKWDIKLNDQVLLKNNITSDKLKKLTGKFMKRYRGPYHICEIVRPHVYKLRDDNGRILGTYHKQLLRPYFHPVS